MTASGVNIKYGSLARSMVISVFSALLAFLLVFLYTNFAPLYFAYDFDIPAIIILHGIRILSDLDTSEWSRDALVTILLAKPIAAIIVGIISFVILMIGRKKPISITILLFWLNVFAFNTAFGVIIDDAIAKSGTYEVALAMDIGNFSMLVMSFIMIAILYRIGMMNGRLIINFFPHQNLTIFKNRLVFFVTIFIVPWFVVVLYTYLSGGATIPVSEMMKNVPVLVLLVPFLTADKIKNVGFKYLPTLNHSKTDLLLTIMFVVLSIVLIFVINNGISITI